MGKGYNMRDLQQAMDNSSKAQLISVLNRITPVYRTVWSDHLTIDDIHQAIEINVDSAQGRPTTADVIAWLTPHSGHNMSNSENSGLVNLVEAMRASSVLKAVKTLPVPKTIGERLSAFAHVYGEGNGYTGHKVVCNGYGETQYIAFSTAGEYTYKQGTMIRVRLGGGAKATNTSSQMFSTAGLKSDDLDVLGKHFYEGDMVITFKCQANRTGVK